MTKNLVFDGLQISNWDRNTLEEVRRGGVHGINATCAVWEGTLETIRNIGDWLVLQNDSPDLARLVTSASEIREAAADGVVGVVLGFQNTSPFEQDYSTVEIFHKLGVRIAQLTYNIQNYVGGSCYDPDDSGLTRFGGRIVEEMNRVGMLVDLSHVGNRTSLDAIHHSIKPVSITHANPLWFSDTPRNKPDEVMQAVVDRGGVVGACLYPNVIGGAETTREAFCDMVIRLVDQLGPDHVAIGSDSARNWDSSYVTFLRDGRWKPKQNVQWPEWSAWFQSPEDFPALANALSDRGLPDEVLTKVLGENWLTLFETVFEPATKLEGVG
ncbi:MAG: membrane dipeptidase [Candidatus Aquiluna sp.]|jgi:membrane dipeptidase|nr:membrane dipeptidase [Aquiluna sp.]